MTLAAVAVLGAASLDARTVRLQEHTEAGWNAYLAATDARRARESNGRDRFLALAYTPAEPGDLQRLRSGAIVVSPVEPASLAGRTLAVPGGAVHHWRGAVFVPAASVTGIVHALRTEPPIRTPDVLDARVLERSQDQLRVFLRLQRRAAVTVAYDTEHLVTFLSHGDTRAETVSVATRIVELADAGTPRERERPDGEDRGFLWRLKAYWRYETVTGGVIAECESVTLSRPVPALLRPLVMPIVDRTARESMERTLLAVRTTFRRQIEAGTPRASSPAR